MTIETKYNIGDEVWFMNEGEPASEKIVRIDVEQYERKQFVEYTVVLSDVILTSFYEQELFPHQRRIAKEFVILSNILNIGKNLKKFVKLAIIMKLYTSNEQTAKLIELGVEKPRYATMFWQDNKEVTEINYTIGELIEMLPQYLDYKGGVADMPTDYYPLTIRKNVVMYCDPYMDWVEILCNEHKELIDNLYDMVTILKEEGVI